MDLIEQYIRNIIAERDEVTTESGYKIKILSSHLGNTEIERLRSRLIQDRAEKNGCVYGFGIVATKKNKAGSDAALAADIVDTMKKNPDIMQYFKEDYRIILSKPRETGKRRKFYAAWVLDMSTKSVFANKLRLFEKLKARSGGFKTYISFNFMLQRDGTEIITQARAIEWTKTIVSAMQDLYKIKDTDPTYKSLFPTEEQAREFNAAIPDFTDMLFGVKVDDEDIEQEKATSEIVTIDSDYVIKNQINTSFRGKAKIQVDPVTTRTTIIPIEGKLFSGAQKIANARADDPSTEYVPDKLTTADDPYAADYAIVPIYNGKFTDNGKLDTGTWYFVEPDLVPPKWADWWSAIDVDGKIAYEGTFDPTSEGDKVKFLQGKLYYKTLNTPYAGWRDDAVYFEGTFKETTPWNGDYYGKNAAGNFVRISYVKNGKAKGKKLIFPYTIGSYKYYQDPTNTSQVYAYDNGCGCFLRVETRYLTDLVDNEITTADFATKVTPITDPDINKQLCVTFNIKDNFITAKPTTTMEFYKEKTPNNYEKTIQVNNIDSTTQYMRRLQNLNTVKSGYRTVGLISGLSWNTTTAEFDYTLITKAGKKDIWYPESELQP